MSKKRHYSDFCEGSYTEFMERAGNKSEEQKNENFGRDTGEILPGNTGLGGEAFCSGYYGHSSLKEAVKCGCSDHYNNQEYSTNCFCVGHHAGEDITTDNNIIILGDNIPDHNNPPEWAYVCDNLPNYKILIGPTIGGKRNELYYCFKKENKQNEPRN